MDTQVQKYNYPINYSTVKLYPYGVFLQEWLPNYCQSVSQ